MSLNNTTFDFKLNILENYHFLDFSGMKLSDIKSSSIPKRHLLCHGIAARQGQHHQTEGEGTTGEPQRHSPAGQQRLPKDCQLLVGQTNKNHKVGGWHRVKQGETQRNDECHASWGLFFHKTAVNMFFLEKSPCQLQKCRSVLAVPTEMGKYQGSKRLPSDEVPKSGPGHSLWAMESQRSKPISFLPENMTETNFFCANKRPIHLEKGLPVRSILQIMFHRNSQASWKFHEHSCSHYFLMSIVKISKHIYINSKLTV